MSNVEWYAVIVNLEWLIAVLNTFINDLLLSVFYQTWEFIDELLFNGFVWTILDK